MARLPGHWLPRSAPVKTTAHTTPSRLTTVAHMSRLKPPLDCWRAAVKALFKAAWLGSPAHCLDSAIPSSPPQSASPASAVMPHVAASAPARKRLIRALEMVIGASRSTTGWKCCLEQRWLLSRAGLYALGPVAAHRVRVLCGK